MIEKPKIGGVTVAAPLWNGASEADLRGIVDNLSKASHHYADDSGREWGQGDLAKIQAATEINRLRLGDHAIDTLYEDKPQLVSKHALIDAVLKGARK